MAPIAVCFAMSKGKVSIFIDGEMVKEAATERKDIYTTDIAFIGSGQGKYGFYRGTIDELRVSRKICSPNKMGTIVSLMRREKTIRYASIQNR